MVPDQIINAVKHALSEHLRPAMLKNIRVYQETDADGEEILRFQVIIDRAGPALEPDKVFYATGIVRQVLSSMNDQRFPLLTFPSSDEIPEVAA